MKSSAAVVCDALVFGSDSHYAHQRPYPGSLSHLQTGVLTREFAFRRSGRTIVCGTFGIGRISGTHATVFDAPKWTVMDEPASKTSGVFRAERGLAANRDL